MKFTVDAVRRAAVAMIAGVLVACGGSGTQLDPFVPSRVLAFGDEASVITDASYPQGAGWKYTVNAVSVTDPTVLNCALNPIWVQYLAGLYALTFPECPGSAVAPTSRIRAKPGATVADLVLQVSAQLALPADQGGGFNGSDLVTVLVGTHDIVALYALYDGLNEAQLTSAAQQLGRTIAAQVNRIGDAGGKVLITTVPLVGFTPFGVALGVDGAALLNRLTNALNEQILLNIENDGHKIGLLEFNGTLTNVIFYPASFGYVNVLDASCLLSSLVPDFVCTTATLKEGAVATTWVWASPLQFGPQGHFQLGSAAASRVSNNPF